MASGWSAFAWLRESTFTTDLKFARSTDTRVFSGCSLLSCAIGSQGFDARPCRRLYSMAFLVFSVGMTTRATFGAAGGKPSDSTRLGACVQDASRAAIRKSATFVIGPILSK